MFNSKPFIWLQQQHLLWKANMPMAEFSSNVTNLSFHIQTQYAHSTFLLPQYTHWSQCCCWICLGHLLKAHQRIGLPLTSRSNKLLCVQYVYVCQKNRGKQAMQTDKRKNMSRKIKGAAHPNMTQYVNQTSIASICNYRRGEKSRWECCYVSVGWVTPQTSFMRPFISMQ